MFLGKPKSTNFGDYAAIFCVFDGDSRESNSTVFGYVDVNNIANKH